MDGLAERHLALAKLLAVKDKVFPGSQQNTCLSQHVQLNCCPLHAIFVLGGAARVDDEEAFGVVCLKRSPKS